MTEFNVALYARISSEQKANAGSIESQLAVLRERIKQDGYRLSPDLTFVDQGYSGATLIRPALERLRDAVSLQTIARLYVLSPDRLARNYAYQVLLIDELQRAGVEVVFLNRDVAQTPEDQLLLQMQGMIAEYERAKILERSRRGKRHAAQTGQVAVLSGAPYGYRYVSKHDGGGQARYEVIEREVDAVHQMFAWVGVERVSIGEVCRRLKKAGIPSPKGKTAWDRATVRGILKNPAYKGLAAFGKTREGPLRPRLRAQRGHLLQPRRATSTTDQRPTDWTLIPVPPIVDVDMFEAVQTQLEENRRRARQGQRGARYLLQGLLVCAQCGYALYGKAVSLKAGKGHRRDYAYYRCIGCDAFRFGGERICDNLQVRTDLLDQAVWDEVCGLLQNPQRLQQEYERRLKAPGPEDGKQIALQAQLQKLEQGISRLIDSYAEGVIQKSEFEPRVTRLKQRRAELEKQAQQLQDQETLQAAFRLAIHRLEEFGDKVNAGLKEADWQMRRELIRTLVKRVEVGKEAVKIVFRIPPDSGGLRSNETILHYWGRSNHPALRRPVFTLRPTFPFQHARLQPFLDEGHDALVPDPVLDELLQPFVRERIERSHNLMPPSTTRPTSPLTLRLLIRLTPSLDAVFR